MTSFCGMSKPEVGSRVFAIVAADDVQVELLGFGTYVGEEVPPVPPGPLQAILGVETWEELDKLVEEANLVPPEERPLRKTNPKIQLDDGRVVWGYECWWAPEGEYSQFKGERAEVQV